MQNTKALILAFIRDYSSPSRIWLEDLLPPPHHSGRSEESDSYRLFASPRATEQKGLGTDPLEAPPLLDGHGCRWHFHLLNRMLKPRLCFEAVEGCGDCYRCVIEA